MATRSMRRTTQGGIAWMWRNGEGCVRLRMLASAGSYAGQKEGMCSGKNTCLLSDAGGGVQRNRNGRGQVFAFVSVGADIKANTIGAAAHLSWEILVSLRTAASAEAPSSPKLLPWTLQSMGEVGVVRDEACQWALTRKRTLGAAAH